VVRQVWELFHDIDRCAILSVGGIHARKMMTKETKTGFERDLQLAEITLLASEHDPKAYAKALRDYFAAHRNYTNGAMVPMFVEMVERALDLKLAPVVIGIGGLQASVTCLNDGFQSLSEIVSGLSIAQVESKEDRTLLHNELRAVKADVQALTDAFTALCNEFVIYQAGSKRAEVVVLMQQVAEMRGNYSDDERSRLTRLFLSMLKDYEDANRG
jgi:hypothetical protein